LASSDETARQKHAVKGFVANHHPTEGFADITGRVGSLLEVGTGFHPELTGRENIYLNGAILGSTGRNRPQVPTKSSPFLMLRDFSIPRLNTIRGGMYMRLAFAVAAHIETES